MIKKIILTLVIFTIPSLIIAKKNSQLVFKSVNTFAINEVSTTGISSYYKPDSATAWKINKVQNGTGTQTTNIIVNGVTIRSSMDAVYPIWLGDNDSIAFSLDFNKMSNVFVSSLEFEIVD